MVFRQAVFGVLTVLPVFAQFVNTSPATDGIEKVAPRNFGPIRDKGERGDGTVTSSNWSGYAVLGSSFTSASGSWVVPQASCAGVSGDQYAAFWVGLDGYSSNTVEQTGTDSDCIGGRPNYYAWYEFYPHPSYLITTLSVQAGNTISASVTYSESEFILMLTNESTGKSWTKTEKVNGAQRTSAEWIAEAPCCSRGGGILPLSAFGTVLFGYDSTGQKGTNAATDSSNSGTIGTFPGASIEQINKVGSSSSPQTPTCSPVSADGTSFSCISAR